MATCRRLPTSLKKRGTASLAGDGSVERAQRDTNLCGEGGASTGFSQWGSFGGHALRTPDGVAITVAS